MSSSSRSSTDDSLYDIEELLHIEARCRELRREKDLLRETQSQSFDLIKKLELHVRCLNEARLEDKRQIQELERELSNCHQQIDYLQDQVNAKDVEVECLEEQVEALELKLADSEVREVEIDSLREALKKSNSECKFLMQELEVKETELQKSRFDIEKLEESISSAALEYQCEIETMRLEMMAMEQGCFGAKRFEEEPVQEKTKLNELFRCEDAQNIIQNLENENNLLRESLDASKKEVERFRERVEEHFKGWRESKEEHELCAAGEVGPCGEVLGPLLSKLLALGPCDSDSKARGERLSCRLHEYEQLVKQLKDELREQKLRAKEEGEDLAQEMAELRYQMTELLEEERKRRACIEQTSLQRISQLEAQLRREQAQPIGIRCTYTCET